MPFVLVEVDLMIFKLLIDAKGVVNAEELATKTDSSPLLLGQLLKSSDYTCGSQSSDKERIRVRSATQNKTSIGIYYYTIRTHYTLSGISRNYRGNHEEYVYCQQHYYPP